MANKGAKQILIYLFLFFLEKTNLKELEDIYKQMVELLFLLLKRVCMGNNQASVYVGIKDSNKSVPLVMTGLTGGLPLLRYLVF